MHGYNEINVKIIGYDILVDDIVFYFLNYLVDGNSSNNSFVNSSDSDDGYIEQYVSVILALHSC